jgi:hypothetical protein
MTSKQMAEITAAYLDTARALKALYEAGAISRAAWLLAARSQPPLEQTLNRQATLS